jgi:putative nucleotidyltransferase with HDIG domain
VKLFRSTLLITLSASTVPGAVLVALLWASGRLEARSLAVAAGVGFVVALALSAGYARSLARQVSQVVVGALEVARGRFGRQVSVTARNEIGELAYTFNHMSRELHSYDQENRRLIAALEAGYLATIQSLASAIDAKDPYTRGHSQRVSHWAVEIGREMGLPEGDLKALEYGGLLHDIGKIGISEPILHKAGALTDEEMRQMRQHPVIGAEILRDVPFLSVAAQAVLGHHERWDGHGYPAGLAADAIPLVARIVNAADTWDACRSARPYQEAMSVEQALAVMARLRGTQTDPVVHEALVRAARSHQAISAERRAAGREIAPGGNGP